MLILILLILILIHTLWLLYFIYFDCLFDGACWTLERFAWLFIVLFCIVLCCYFFLELVRVVGCVRWVGG